MTTQSIRNSISRSPLRLGLPRVQPIWIILAFLLIPLVLACFGFAPGVQAATEGDLGKGNTVEGSGALQSLTTGIHDTALGYQTLFLDTTGNYNTATGSQALKNNTGDNNTADGFQALYFNTTGANNAATGWRALFHNTTGDANTANGLQALNSNTIGTGNTAMGFQTLFSNTTGNHNAAVGEDALSGNTTGSFNIALGYGCGGNVTTGSFNIDIGNKGFAGDNSTIRIGTSHSATFIAGISGVAVTGTAVVVNSNGQLGVVPSSARFKTEIKPMDKASEAILALKPITFRYKHELDPKGTLQFGLVAEEVEKVNPDLVARDAKGEVYTVRYDTVNAMLLNEFLKEHRMVQELKSTAAKQEATIAQQQKDFRATAAQQQEEIQALTASLKEQAAQIQKVGAQLEVNRPAPQMVGNGQ
jgi:hypothetical protein